MEKEDEFVTFIRRGMSTSINSHPKEREELEEKYGKVYDTKQLMEEFEVTAFLAPFVEVVKKSDGKKGILVFQHMPRYYFDYTPVEAKHTKGQGYGI